MWRALWLAGLEAPSCYRIWLPRWICGKESSCQCRSREFDSWTGKIPWRRKWQSSTVFLSGKSYGQRSLADYCPSVQFSSVQLLSPVRLFSTPWTAACQASLSITNSQSSPKLTFIESVMPSNHLILCRPLLLLPSIFLSLRVFSNESVLPIILELQLQHEFF